jgi:hypothetical protein
MKNILLIYYSQSGQLDEIAANLSVPFKDFEIDKVRIEPKKNYPFPWSTEVFFGIMPETVLLESIELKPYTLQRAKYDLVIIGYQPWFLSPSQPITSLLKDTNFQKVLKDTPVATFIGARNMWLNAHETVVKFVEDAGGIMVANIPFIDKVQNHISALTILHWMLTGKKTKRWGFLPIPGIDQLEIEGAGELSRPLVQAVEKNNFEGVQEMILNLGKINIKSSILLIESKVKKPFRIWANLIKKKGKTPKRRSFWVSFFKYYLLIALFVISPIILIFQTLLKPLFLSRTRKKRNHFLYLGIKKNKHAVRL